MSYLLCKFQIRVSFLIIIVQLHEDEFARTAIEESLN